MESIKLNYGDKQIDISIEGAKSIQVLQERPMDEISNLRETFNDEITNNCIASPPLNEIISEDDLITIIVSDITRFWTRQDLICELLVDYLTKELKVSYENIAILIALGTHRKMTENEMEKIVSSKVYAKVNVINHDCMATDLKYVGTTSYGTDVYVNPLAVNRKVILIGGTVHHLMSGYGGGRKSILPGISGKSTVNQNHMHSLSPRQPSSNPLIGMGLLKGNPVHEDMTEAAAFVNPAFGINIVANSNAKHCRLLCGHWLKAWEESCTVVNEYFGIPIHKKADIVIASCGGFPKDINLYQSVKSLLNASQALKDGGTMIFLAECREGGGAPDFFNWIKSLKTDTLDEDLRADFSIAGYIFYASYEAIKRGHVYMLSSIPNETVKDMKLKTFSEIESLMKHIDFTDKDVYIMPYGGNTVPFVEK